LVTLNTSITSISSRINAILFCLPNDFFEI
jgi:hypothetical protein